jgi:hypothetical protein
MRQRAVIFLVTLALGAMPALAGEEPILILTPEQTALEGLQEQPEFLPWETPAATPKTCTASFNCGDGNTISCVGNSTCQVYSYVGAVSCDGNRTDCPNQCRAYIHCQCGVLQCYSTSGNCTATSCNGFQLSCNFCPDVPEW